MATDTNLDGLRVVDLKERCQKQGLSGVGKKAELIERLSQAQQGEQNDHRHASDVDVGGSTTKAEKEAHVSNLKQPSGLEANAYRNGHGNGFENISRIETNSPSEAATPAIEKSQVVESSPTASKDKLSPGLSSSEGQEVKVKIAKDLTRSPSEEGYAVKRLKQGTHNGAAPADPFRSNVCSTLAVDKASRSAPSVTSSDLPAVRHKAGRLGVVTKFAYIGNLVRPMTIQKVDDLVSSYGPLERSFLLPYKGGDQGIWLDPIKTHAYVVFAQEESAAAFYSDMDGKRFPADTGKVEGIVIDFLKSEHITAFVTKEIEAGRQARFALVWNEQSLPELVSSDQASSRSSLSVARRIVAREVGTSEPPRKSLSSRLSQPIKPERRLATTEETSTTMQTSVAAPKDEDIGSKPLGSVRLARTAVQPRATDPPSAHQAPRSAMEAVQRLQWTSSQPSISWTPVELDIAKRRLERMEDI